MEKAQLQRTSQDSPDRHGRIRILPGGVRARLYLLVALMLLPLVVLVGFNYYQRYQSRRLNALQTELEVAQGVATTFSASVEGIRRQSLSVGQAINAFSPNSAIIAVILRASTDKAHAVRNMSWVGPDGTVIASSAPGLRGRSLAERPYFRKVVAGQPWAIGDITPVGTFVKKPTVGIATGIRKGNGKLAGVVVAALEPTRIEELSLTQRTAEGAALVIFDAQGTLVYHSQSAPIDWGQRVRWIESDPVLRHVLKTGRSEVGIVQLGHPGETWLAARVVIPDIGWVAGAGCPADAVFSPLRRRLAQDTMLVSAVLGIAFLLAFQLGRDIVNPLLRLERDAKGMAGGGIIAADDPAAPAEIRTLRETIAAMAHDLLDRAEAVRLSERRFRTALGNLPDMVVIFAPDFRIVYVNPATCRSMGLSSSEFAGRRDDEVWPEIYLQWRPLLHAALEEGVVEKVRLDLPSAGGIRSVSFTSIPLSDETGRVREIMAIMHDYTERKQAEDRLRESEAALRTLFDSAYDGILVHGLDGLIVDVNDRWLEMFDLTRQEVEGLSISDISEGQPAVGDFLLFWEEVLAGEDKFFQWRARRPRDGSGFDVEVFLRRVRFKGQDRIMANVRDITERKQIEQELQKAKEELEDRVRERTKELAAALEDLKHETRERLAAVEDLRQKEQLLLQQNRLAAMGEMIGNIAHQWRQPLNTVGLIIQELPIMYELGQFSQEYLQQSSAKAMRVLTHMSRTIDDFRNFFRPDKERVEFSINEAVAHTVSLVEASFQAQQIRIEVQEHDALVIEGHPREFSQVILNLLMNARDAFAERHIAAPAVVVTLFRKGNSAVIVVADNAGGVPESIIGRIFDPYFTTKGPDKGTGIGLFMSKNIIEKNMGGKLSVRNVAEGAEFRIEV